MTYSHDLPECGIVPSEDFEDGDAWREIMQARQDRLVDETTRILNDHDDASDVAQHLNRLYVPFNTYDRRGDLNNHLVAVPRSSGVLHIQFHDGDLDYDTPMDHRVLERHDSFWWLDDAELPEDADPAKLHGWAAVECLGLVWWGNEEMIEQTPVGAEKE